MLAKNCPGSCRDQLLDSAEAVVHSSGIASLTLDAVAAHAKVSKGGLLYHFPSKDKLIEALVRRICEAWREDYTRAINEVEEGPGRVPRGLLNMCLATPGTWTETCRRSSMVLVAVLANNPDLVKPLREVWLDLFRMLKDDRIPGPVGEAVILAINGLWFERIFGLNETPAARLDGIRIALEAFVKHNMPGDERKTATVNRGKAKKAASRASKVRPARSGKVKS